MRDLKRIVRFVLFAWYIISVGCVFTIYYFHYWLYEPPPSQLQSAPLTLQWPDQETMFSCLGRSAANCTIPEYYQIPMIFHYYNNSITQNQQVYITSSGASISTNLAKGLEGVQINYRKSVQYSASGASAGHVIDLILVPVNQTGVPLVKALVQVLPPSSIEWQFAGSDFPTVTLEYDNGSLIHHEYPDQSLDIQSETITNEAINSEIRFQKEFGIIMLPVVFGGISTILEKAYRFRFGKNE